MSDPGGAFNTIGSGLTLGSGISSLFGGGDSSANNTTGSQANPYTKTFVTPGYTFGGGVLANRDATGYANQNAALQGLYGNQLGALNAFSTGNLAPLSARLAPGYGQLTQAMVGAAQNKGAQTYGNLRDQLAQRNILGASFAQNSLSGQQSQNLQDENLARANAFQQEMQSTLGLNQQQMDVLAQQLANANSQTALVNQQATQKLNELGVAAGFLSKANQTDSPVAQAYKQAAIAQSLGAAGGTSGGTTGGTAGGTAPAGHGTGTGAFAGLPVPNADDHKWTQIYQNFLKTGDVAGYRAYLQSRGFI